MPDTVELVTVPNVHLLSTGRWEVAAGPEVDPVTGHPIWTVTAEDLAAIVEAQQDPGVRTPIIKLGHDDQVTLFEMPAVGRIENLRISDDGQDLYGDYVGVPKWLAEALPSAYPSRSVEVAMGRKGSTGHAHRAILTAVAILGPTLPAIESLEDVRALYTGEYEELVAAAGAPAGEGLVLLERNVRASVSIDTVRQAFYDRLPAGSWAWIRECWSDFLIVDDDDGGLYRIPWTEGADGVDFGDPIRVTVEYVEAPASATGEPAPILLGRFAGHDPRLSPRATRDPQEGSPMPNKDLAARLGLPEDATDEQIDEAVSAVLSERDELRESGAGGDTTVELPEGTVAIDAEALATLQAQASQGVEAFQTLADRHRDEVLDGAIKAGKFPPARRAHWVDLWARDPEGTEAAIAELAAGLIPTGGPDAALGQSTSPEQMSDDAIWTALYGSEA